MFHRHDHDRCRNTALQKAEAICIQNGTRLTDQRRQVLKHIWESHKPVKAYEILDKISDEKRKNQPPIVYRALDFLMENGLIHRIDSLNAFMGCNHPEADHDCFFLICKDCGNADECCSADIKSTIANVTQAENFTADFITLELHGQCKNCRQM